MSPTQNSPNKSTFNKSIAVTGFCTLHDVRGEFYCYNSLQSPSLQSLFSAPQKEFESTFPLESFLGELEKEKKRKNF
jgi:hypothetical protein